MYETKGDETMSMLTELFGKAQVLPPTEREQLAMMLLETLPDEDNVPIVLDPEDEAELERRLEAIRTGQAKGHSLESVMESIKATLRKPPAE
jgi:putative addiction module component (TIGR02574 family)